MVLYLIENFKIFHYTSELTIGKSIKNRDQKIRYRLRYFFSEQVFIKNISLL